MGHHHHPPIDPQAGDRRVGLAIGVNLALSIAQVVGGVMAGSLALIADALHNFSDTISLVIAFAARRIGRRPADAAMTFGYGRAEIVAALINYTTLIVIGLYLVFEAAMRFFDPQPVGGWLIVIVAAVALTVDTVTALLTWRMSRTSMNIRAAFLHNLADALGSVAVIVAGVLIILFGWVLVDPIVTLMIAGYILWMSFTEIGGVIRMLMLGSPPGLETDDVVRALKDVEGVEGVHHARVWQLAEHEPALDAHLIIATGAWHRADDVKARAKTVLRDRLGIRHSTLEMECHLHACDTPDPYGHGRV